MAKSASLDVKKMLDKYAEQKVKFGGSGNWHKLTDGENVVRLVTFANAEGRDELYVHARTHFLPNVGTLPCLRKDKGDACPICEYASQLRKRGNDQLAGKLAARNRAYFNVIIGGEIKQIEVGPKVLAEIMKYFADEDYGNIADLNEGRHIKITKTGSGLNTEYSVIVAPKVTSIKLPADPVDLYTLLPQQMEYDELADKFFQHYEKLDDEGEGGGEGAGEGAEGAEGEEGSSSEEDDGTGFSNEPAPKAAPKSAPKKPTGGKNSEEVIDSMFGKAGGTKNAGKAAPAKPAGKPKPKPR